MRIGVASVKASPQPIGRLEIRICLERVTFKLIADRDAVLVHDTGTDIVAHIVGAAGYIDIMCHDIACMEKEVAPIRTDHVALTVVH